MEKPSVSDAQHGIDRHNLSSRVDGRSDLYAALTSDPEAALKFCQSLIQTLKTQADPEKAAESQPFNGFFALPWVGESVEPGLSVVVPIFNEQENLPELYARLTGVLDEVGSDYEIIFVDDGSRDGSARFLHAVAAQNTRVVVVELARNFGHQVAISAGLDYSRGDAVVVMDGDLQDPPEVLPRFIAKWQEGYDVVYAVREQRKESWPKRAAYAGFYRLVRRVANVEIPLDAGDFCIMDRRVVDTMVHMPERNRFVRGIRSWVGYKQIGLPYERHARNAGKPKYTFRHLMYLALDGLVSFSYLPLRLITMMGFAVSMVSIIMAVFYSIKKLTSGLNPPGFATLVVAVLFLAGIQLITMGVIGEYVGRIFEEVKQRPLYVTRRVLRRET